MMSSKDDLYVGVGSPSHVEGLLEEFLALFEDFEEELSGLISARERFDVERVHLLDELLSVISVLKGLENSLPRVSLKGLKREEAKKRVKKRVKVVKKVLSEKKSEKIEEGEKKVVSGGESVESKRVEEVERIKRFREELESLSKQIQKLGF